MTSPAAPRSDAAPRRPFAACVPVAQALALLVAAWFIYAPVLHGSWLWDDGVDITDNAVLRDPGGLRTIWFAPKSWDYLPLKSSVQWLQWQLWHDEPYGYHLTSVALHALSGLLLWRLLARLGVALAWLGGLIFIVHPVAVESVAWIAELKNTLSLPPLLLALGAWLDFDARRRKADYAAALLWFVTAMLCKSSVVMLPVVLLLHAWWKRGRLGRGDFAATAGFFLVSLAFGLVTLTFEHQRAVGALDLSLGGPVERMVAAGRAVGFYFVSWCWPLRPMPIYPGWLANASFVVQLLPWFAIAAVVATGWSRRETWGRHLLLGLGFFGVNLLPVIGLVSMAWLYVAPVGDHFAYLPQIGLIGLGLAALAAAREKFPPLARALPFALAGLVLLLAGRARSYAEIFRGPRSLWTYAVEQNPQAWVAHTNLGSVLLDAGENPAALHHLEIAVQLKPGHPQAQFNLGLALERAGRAADAVAHYEQALAARPGYAEAHSNLGSLLARLGRVDDAIAHFESALRDRPDFVQAHYNFANVLRRAGRASEAIRHYERALQLDPALAEAHNNLGTLLYNQGDVAGARQHFEAALRLKPDYADARNNLAAVKSAAP